MFKNIKLKVSVVLLCIFIIMLLIPVVANANSYDFSVKEQTNEFYVNDFAGIFTEEQKQEMLNKAKELNDNYNGIQVVVTTVDSLGGHEIENYAYAMYNQYRYR